MNYENSHLFSVGQDGMVCIFEVKDRNISGKMQEQRKLEYSQEILTEKIEMDNMQTEVLNLDSELKGIRSNNDQDVGNKISVKKQQEALLRLEQDKTSNAQ